MFMCMFLRSWKFSLNTDFPSAAQLLFQTETCFMNSCWSLKFIKVHEEKWACVHVLPFYFISFNTFVCTQLKRRPTPDSTSLSTVRVIAQYPLFQTALCMNLPYGIHDVHSPSLLRGPRMIMIICKLWLSVIYLSSLIFLECYDYIVIFLWE